MEFITHLFLCFVGGAIGASFTLIYITVAIAVIKLVLSR